MFDVTQVIQLAIHFIPYTSILMAENLFLSNIIMENIFQISFYISFIYTLVKLKYDIRVETKTQYDLIIIFTNQINKS